MFSWRRLPSEGSGAPDETPGAFGEGGSAGPRKPGGAEGAPTYHPLFSLPTFVGTPHMGAGTVDSRELTAVSVVEQLVDVLDGGEPRNVAN